MPNGITTDQLNIKITVDSSGAIEGIDKVKEALGQLKSIAGSRELTGLLRVTQGFAMLNTSVSNLANINFSTMATGLDSFFNSLSAVAANPALASNTDKTAEAFVKLTGPLSSFTKHVSGLSAAARGLSLLKAAIEKFGTGPSIEQIQSMKAPLQELGKVVDVVGKGGNNLNQTRIGIENMTNAISKFSPKYIEKLGPSFDLLSKQVSRFSETAQKGAQAVYRIANSIRSLNETGFDANLQSNIEGAADAFVNFTNKVVNSIPDKVFDRFVRLGEAINNITRLNAANRSLNSFSNSLKRAHSHSNNFSKSMKKVRSSVLQTLFPFKSVAKSVKNFGNAFKKLGHTIQRLVLYRFLRSMIRAITQQVKLGIDALYNWSDVVGYRFKAAMDGLATSFQYLRNSIAAMLSPLVEYLQPVIDSLIDRFVEFLNVVNQFISMMTGKDTYVRAIKGAAKYAEETEYAAAAQEKLNRTVLGFDELNKLNDTDDRGHGSPTVNAGGGEFEEVPITESFGKINWNNLGKKLSDGLATALGNINWQSIQEKTKGVVQKVIGFINSFFGNEEMWTEVGLTVSGGINTLTTAITTFADEGEWKAIGANIQAAFMAAVGDINWENLGKSLVATFKIFANLFIGFASAMTPEDWKDLGTKIGKAVNAAIQDIPWGQLLENMLSFAAGLTDALIAAVKSIEWIKIGQEIKAWWENKSPDLKQKIILDAAKAIAGITAFSLLARGLKGFGGVTKAAKTLTIGLGPLGVLGAIALLVASGPKLKEWCDELSENLEQAFWTPEQSEAYKKQQSEMDNMRKHGKEMLDELLSKGNITQRQYNMWLSEMGDRLAESPEDLQTVISSIERIYSGFEKGLPVKLNTFGKFLGDGTTVMERSGKRVEDSSTGMAQRFEAAGILINGIWSKLTIGTEKNAGIIGSALQTSSASIAKYAEKIGVEIPDSIARGAKNNRKAITEVNGEIIADFTGMKLPDMSVKGGNIPKSLAQGVKNNKNAITKVNGEIVADFTGLKTPDKSAEGSKFARNIAKGVNDGKPTVKNAIDTLARTLDIKLPNMSSAGNGVSTSLAKGITAKKSDVQSAVTGISNAIKLLNKDNDNSPLYPWTWGNDFAASFASGLSSSSAIRGVTAAASTIAARAREYLAFSKPDKGPLSDADTYGPDFMKLYAQGIENSKNLVTNAVSGLASDVNNAMALENTYTLHNEPTGLDSLAQAITNSETPINVYIGSDKLDSVIARSNSRLNYRSGGRF